MALTVEDCDAYLAALYAGLGAGFAEVTRNGQTIRYSTPDQIRSAIAFFEARRATLASVTTAATSWPVHRRLVRFSSGLASSDSEY